MASPLNESITLGTYLLVPPNIYRGTVSLSFPVHNDSTWRSNAPQSLRVQTVRGILSTLKKDTQFHMESNWNELLWSKVINWAMILEQSFFTRSRDMEEYNKIASRECEHNQKRHGSKVKKCYAGKIRVRSLTELAYMKLWEGASEEVKEKASAPTEDPVRLFLRELYCNQESLSLWV